MTDLNLFSSSPAEPPAKTSRWLDAVRDWMAQGPDCSSSSYASLIGSLPIGFCGRTSMALCRAGGADVLSARQRLTSCADSRIPSDARPKSPQPQAFSKSTSATPLAPTSPFAWRASPASGPPFLKKGGARLASASARCAGASGACWTLNGSAWPSDVRVCSLSQVLEECPDPKYCLSPKACRGILRRAERRGKALPPSLKSALERRAAARDATDAG